MNVNIAKKAKELSDEGMGYVDIAEELGITILEARRLVSGDKYIKRNHKSKPEPKSELKPGLKTAPTKKIKTCGHQKVISDCIYKCMRKEGHNGVHLINDKNRRLFYWEN